MKECRMLRMLLCTLLLLLSGCALFVKPRPQLSATMTEIAVSSQPWGGVAVSRSGRLFVSFPSAGDNRQRLSIAEIVPDALLRPFPDVAWNPEAGAPGLSPHEYFYRVSCLRIDSTDFLWVLDSGVLEGSSIEPEAAKLVRIDLHSNSVVQVIPFPEAVTPVGTDLHDLQIDIQTGTAYVSDEGLGAIIVTDIATGESRRLLEGHPSLTSEGVMLGMEGEAWRHQDGTLVKGHVAGLALSPEGEYLYYQALSGKTLYRIKTALLRNPLAVDADLEGGIELVGRITAADALEFAPDGSLYLTDPAAGAIRRISPDHRLELLLQDPRLIWPSSLARGTDGALYVTTSLPLPGERPIRYRLFKITLKEQGR